MSFRSLVVLLVVNADYSAILASLTLLYFLEGCFLIDPLLIKGNLFQRKKLLY